MARKRSLFKTRRSKKIAPGVRVTLTQKWPGLSVKIPGVGSFSTRTSCLLLFTILVVIAFLAGGAFSSFLGEAQQQQDFTPTVWLYLPEAMKNYPPSPTATATATATPTVTPTATPTLPPPSFDGCQEDPNPASAGNYPVRIVVVYKSAVPEVVRLQNVSAQTVSLTNWHMCSINGNQEHDGIGGSLAPSEMRDFAYTGSGYIWNNSERDDGALYNASGQLVSYWIDQ